MSIAIGVALVLTLVLMIVYLATVNGAKYVTALFYCTGAVWFSLQLFLNFKK